MFNHRWTQINADGILTKGKEEEGVLAAKKRKRRKILPRRNARNAKLYGAGQGMVRGMGA